MLVDLAHVLRSLRRSPASAAAAILSLSLTLGAAASIFAVVDAVVLTPPPFADPEAIVTVGEVPSDDLTAAPRTVGYAVFEAWRERAGSLATLEAIDGTNFTLTDLGSAERVRAAYVTPGFLPLLGVTPVRGRLFDRDDVGQRVAIVSHGFWRGKLAGDPGVIGRDVVLGGRPHTVVGVLPEPFDAAFGARDLWLPFPVTPVEAARAGYRVGVVARLSHAVAPNHLEPALDEISRASSPPSRVVATPIRAAIVGDARKMLGLLGGAAGLAMLIAFVNLAGLLIVRSIDRQRELAVRTALGARRSAITRLLLVEAGALVTIGIAGGVLLALWMTPAVARLALAQFGDLANLQVAVSWRVIGVISTVAAACAGIGGSLPAYAAAQRSHVDVLRRGATPPPRELRLRRVFVTGVVALAFVLLVSVALMGRSLFTVLAVNPGFDPRGVLAMQVALPSAIYTPERVVSFYSALQTALEGRLGARAVSVVDEIPLTGDRGRRVVSVRPTEAGREAVVRAVTPAYFDVMRIPVVAGRGFDARDDSSAPPRVVLSESIAQRLFASDPPIGRHVSLAATAQDAEVVGVVGDVKHRALDEAPVSTVYVSAQQSPSNGSIVVVRSARPDADVIATVRDEVARLDRNLPVYGTKSMQEVVATSPGVPARRVLTATFLGFAALGVVLGAIGLFGVVAHDVSRRRAELALRIALGADRRRILNATLGQGAVMAGWGFAIGSVLSFWTSRALSGFVGADGVDVLSISLAALVLAVAGGAAVLPAALRAARTDPIAALRSG